MTYNRHIVERAISLRKAGFSLNEISEELNIAKSTSSLWLQATELSLLAKERLERRQDDGRKSYTKTITAKRTSQQEQLKRYVSKELARDA